MVSARDWPELRDPQHIDVECRTLPEGIDAQTDGLRKIHVDGSLLEVERRCALEHELQHIRMGHTGRQPLRVELTVRAIVARRLIPLHALIAASAWAHDNLWDLSDELLVTPEVLVDRLNHLDPAERAALRERRP